MFYKIPDKNLWREWWPVWGYVGAELAQSSYLGDSKIQSISACVHDFVTFSYLANFSQTLLVDDIDI